MGFGRRLVRKTIRKATPRSVRRAMHPVRTVKNAVTPRPLKQLSRAAYTITNPLGAAENKIIGAVLNGGRGGSGRGRGRTQPVTSQEAVGYSGVRAIEAVASTDRLAELMAVQRQRFAAPSRPLVPGPASVDPAPFRKAESVRRRGEARFWQRAKRRQIRGEVELHVRGAVARESVRLQAVHHEHQTRADAWWSALLRGEQQVLTAALRAAFADNSAPVSVVHADAASATLVVGMPGMDVLPDKKAHVTPTGRLSAKAWTKTELNEVYADLVAAHLLATIRESWAVGPSLVRLRVVGIRRAPLGANELLFDVDVTRDGGRWADDRQGRGVLHGAPVGLNRSGRTLEVRCWPPGQCRPDIPRLLLGAGTVTV